jgi:hypothetical protein
MLDAPIKQQGPDRPLLFYWGARRDYFVHPRTSPFGLRYARSESLPTILSRTEYFFVGSSNVQQNTPNKKGSALRTPFYLARPERLLATSWLALRAAVAALRRSAGSAGSSNSSL